MGMAKINVANPSDKGFWGHSFLLCFGAYGDTMVLAYADHLEAALDECVDWLAENAPGLLCDDEVNDEYARVLAETGDEEAAMEAAEVDVIRAGNAGNCLHSWEWFVRSEDPSKERLIAIAKGR